MRRLEKLLRPFFDKYDDDKSGQLDRGEFWSVFHDLQEHVQTQVRVLGEKVTALCPVPQRFLLSPLLQCTGFVTL